jgi:hypothetical protein
MFLNYLSTFWGSVHRFILVDTIKQDLKPIEEDIKRILAATAAPVAVEA